MLPNTIIIEKRTQTYCNTGAARWRARVQNQFNIKIYLMWHSGGVWHGCLLRPELKAPLCDLQLRKEWTLILHRGCVGREVPGESPLLSSLLRLELSGQVNLVQTFLLQWRESLLTNTTGKTITFWFCFPLCIVNKNTGIKPKMFFLQFQ